MFLEAVSALAYLNPFLPERIEHEKAALGDEFQAGEPIWSADVEDPDRPRTNVWRIAELLDPLLEQIRGRLRDGARPRGLQMQIYQDGVLQLLYQRYYGRLHAASFGEPAGGRAGRWNFYRDFLDDWNHFFRIGDAHGPAHAFACFRQIERAFDQIFRDVIGASLPAARLRASIWQSIFTHDMRRYQRTLFARMGEFATLITGPSGTGKELAARAIAQSRYVSFDEATLSFADDGVSESGAPAFLPINISALSPALVESELFGHRRGSFTGAIADRKGWLEACPALGSVFLDELGELDLSIQVKLLRVIETRSFHPVGDTGPRQFRGKLIAATNRDLAARIAAGEFREDLYYRLCSDQIVTPSLAEQVAESPQVLEDLIVYMARRVAGPEGESLARDVSQWIEKNLGPGYGWPGNYRELEQCVKNVLIRRDYRPVRTSIGAPGEPAGRLAAEIQEGRLTAAELVSRYVTLVYQQTGSYEETGRRLGLDRRTVKAKVDRLIS